MKMYKITAELSEEDVTKVIEALDSAKLRGNAKLHIEDKKGKRLIHKDNLLVPSRFGQFKHYWREFIKGSKVVMFQKIS